MYLVFKRLVYLISSSDADLNSVRSKDVSEVLATEFPASSSSKVKSIIAPLAMVMNELSSSSLESMLTTEQSGSFIRLTDIESTALKSPHCNRTQDASDVDGAEEYNVFDMNTKKVNFQTVKPFYPFLIIEIIRINRVLSYGDVKYIVNSSLHCFSSQSFIDLIVMVHKLYTREYDLRTS